MAYTKLTINVTAESGLELTMNVVKDFATRRPGFAIEEISPTPQVLPDVYFGLGSVDASVIFTLPEYGVYELTFDHIPQYVSGLGHSTGGVRLLEPTTGSVDSLVTSIVLDDTNLTTINESAISGYKSLSGTIVVPRNITSIGAKFLYNCNGVDTVTANTDAAPTDIYSLAYDKATTKFNDKYVGDVTIPEGNAIKIVDDTTGDILWEKGHIITVDGDKSAEWGDALPNQYGTPYRELTIVEPPDAVYAVLYSDGLLCFQETNTDEFSGAHGTVSKTYKKNANGWYSGSSTSANPKWYNDRTSVTSVSANAKVTSNKFYYFFYGFSSVTSINLSNFDTSNAVDMSQMFYGCSQLTSLNLSNFNTSNATNMKYMFHNCTSLTSLNVSNFDTSNVTDMGNMFYSCSSLTSLNLSNFNTSNVTSMGSMFNKCSSLTSLDLSNFTTSNVTNMNSMFYGCSQLTSLDVSNFDTSNVPNMNNMFGSCSKLTSLNLSNFNTSNVTIMTAMFSYCYKLAPPSSIENWDTSKVTNMMNMFSLCGKDVSYSLDLSGWNVNLVTNHSNFADGVTDKITEPIW